MHACMSENTPSPPCKMTHSLPSPAYLYASLSCSQEFETPPAHSPVYDALFRDWLDTDTIVNVSDLPSHMYHHQCSTNTASHQSIVDLSPITTLSDLADVIPEEDENHPMPHSLRRVLTPPRESSESSARPRSILFEQAVPHTLQSTSAPSSPYSKPRWSPASDHSHHGGVLHARHSTTSIGSCSTVQTKIALPVKSILTRHDSGISMAATSKPTHRKKKRSPPSVKFVDAPTIYYDHGVYLSMPSPHSSPPPASDRQKIKPSRWFTRWWKRPSPSSRPVISGPYSLSSTASLVDVYSSRSPKPGKLKLLWMRVASVIR
ncbi:hypothetical protein PAXRUDRAFT_414954 [Paxillus rubicundulus Ve08.2h10]|uniref:Uncharacterized protein n=1 Tax=Paxillus rubicundulus Ve08.2h10 TaxID=930991 RepID=A0A0D0E5H8_9AGAM|nr:hypothetical protein PAXRUDRAFT_414954 [Paxillus rubicundulus Ve08.2h10]